MYYSAITATFSAAHALRNYQGKCERLHGHNWKIEVLTATETLDAAGMGLDFTVLREHRCGESAMARAREFAADARLAIEPLRGTELHAALTAAADFVINRDL